MRLKVHSDLEELLDVEICDGKLQYWYVKKDLQSAVLRWVDRGILEWIPSSEDKYDYLPRETQIDHPEFLKRLKEYLERQFHFTYQLL